MGNGDTSGFPGKNVAHELLMKIGFFHFLEFGTSDGIDIDARTHAHTHLYIHTYQTSLLSTDTDNTLPCLYNGITCRDRDRVQRGD